MSTEEVKIFDVTNYTVGTNSKREKIVIEETGDEFEISVKPLSWAKRNQLISDHMNWDANGNTSFNASNYMRACLREMIVDAPWGKTTEGFLISIDERLGSALEKIVPQAFGTEGVVDIDATKKE